LRLMIVREGSGLKPVLLATAVYYIENV